MEPNVHEIVAYHTIALGSFNTVTDAFLTLIPAILIEHTRLSFKHKVGLACLLCLSVLYELMAISNWPVADHCRQSYDSVHRQDVRSSSFERGFRLLM